MRTLPLPIATALDPAFTAIVQAWDSPPAVVAALFDAQGIQWLRCHGEPAPGSGAAADEHTTFALASGTKTLAVASIGQLCDANALSWDTLVSAIDPAFDAGAVEVTEELTLRDLACHRTGWTSSEGRHRAAAVSRADLVRRIRFHGFRHPFRQQFAYCTDGFTVLGHAVDIVAGQAWERFAETQLLQPLGMTRTCFTVDQALAAGNFAHPHLRMPDGTHVRIPWRYEDGVATPAGGANTCVADMARWLGAWLRADGPWSKTQQHAMLQGQIHNEGPCRDEEFSCAVPLSGSGISGKQYCLGWYAHRYRGERVVHHTGGIRGFRSIIALLPERQRGFACFVNADCAYLPRAMFQAALDAIQGHDPLTWTASFLELELAARTRLPPYLSELPRSAIAGRFDTLAGVYEDDGRFGQVRIAACTEHHELSAGPLRLLLCASTTGARMRCFEACGSLYIDRGELTVDHAANDRIAGFTLFGAQFRRSG